MTKQSGFSLIELSIYFAIVAIIAVVMVPMLTSWIGRTRISRAESELLVLKGEIQRYSFDIGGYPKKLEDLITKPAEKEAAEKWHYAYVDPTTLKINADGKISDPWGEPYQYRVTKGKTPPFELYSNGDPEASEPFRIDVWKIKSK